MKRTAIAGLIVVMFASPSFRQEKHRHLFICRSPLLAFDFWNSLKEVEQKGVKVTPQIAQEVCARMRAGKEPQCLKIEADSIKPISAAWQGALAISDGRQRIWFHNPDGGGWICPEYYVSFINAVN